MGEDTRVPGRSPIGAEKSKSMEEQRGRKEGKLIFLYQANSGEIEPLFYCFLLEICYYVRKSLLTDFNEKIILCAY